MITNGAVSVLNAIPTGIGSAVGIRLSLIAEIADNKEASTRDDVANEVIRAAFGKEAESVSIKIRSEIPQGYGLKSSSAFTAAVIGEYSAFKGMKLSKEGVCMKSAEVSRKLGMSITGAIDDAAASLFDGIVVTDNRKDMIISHRSFETCRVLVTIPPLKRSTSIRERLRSRDFSKAVDLLMDGDYAGCARLNGILVAETLGYPVEPLRRIEELGSRMFGYSGNGPAIYATCDDSNIGRLEAYMRGLGKLIITEVR